MNTISLARLCELLDAYGAEPAHWPEQERSAALALLATSQEARQLAGVAHALDQVLDQWQPQHADAALSERLLSLLPNARPGWRELLAQIWEDLGGWRLAAPAFAASVAMGALLPGWIELDSGDVPDEDLIAAVQFIDEPPDFEP